MKCPYCGHENADNAESCERCYAGFPVKDNKPKQEEKPTALRKRTRS